MNQKIEQLLDKYPVILQVLRFGTIGAINTAIDFIVFNMISKFFGITSGWELGLINIIGFTAAMVQSYFWNRYWTFGHATAPVVAKRGRAVSRALPVETVNKVSPLHELLRLMLVGGLGAIAFLVVLVGASYQVYPLFYLIVLALFLGLQAMLWLVFGLKQKADNHSTHFLVFAIVSIIGLLINIAIVSISSYYLVGSRWGLNADFLKNEAKILATIASLVWNFIGYKLFVFKR